MPCSKDNRRFYDKDFRITVPPITFEWFVFEIHYLRKVPKKGDPNRLFANSLVRLHSLCCDTSEGVVKNSNFSRCREINLLAIVRWSLRKEGQL